MQTMPILNFSFYCTSHGSYISHQAKISLVPFLQEINQNNDSHKAPFTLAFCKPFKDYVAMIFKIEIQDN